MSETYAYETIPFVDLELLPSSTRSLKLASPIVPVVSSSCMLWYIFFMRVTGRRALEFSLGLASLIYRQLTLRASVPHLTVRLPLCSARFVSFLAVRPRLVLTLLYSGYFGSPDSLSGFILFYCLLGLVGCWPYLYPERLLCRRLRFDFLGACAICSLLLSVLSRVFSAPVSGLLYLRALRLRFLPFASFCCRLGFLLLCSGFFAFRCASLLATSDPGRDVCRLGIGRCCCAEGRSPNFWSLPCSSATSAGSLSFLRRQLRGYIGELCLVPVISVDTFRLLGLFRLLVLVVTARIGPRSRVVTTTDPAVYSPLDFLSRLGPVPVWLSVGGSSLFASLSVR
ncbi:hypothetical protein Tco_0594766 [Tanacetum coccineum]